MTHTYHPSYGDHSNIYKIFGLRTVTDQSPVEVYDVETDEMVPVEDARAAQLIRQLRAENEKLKSLVEESAAAEVAVSLWERVSAAEVGHAKALLEVVDLRAKAASYRRMCRCGYGK